MRLSISRCVLLILLFACFATPASAGTIVGNFFFQRDVCDPSVDFFCDPPFRFEYFGLVKTDPPELPGFTFSASVQLQNGGVSDNYDFFDSGITELLRSQPFPGQVSLTFNIENGALYPGTLGLSAFVYDEAPLDSDLAPTFSAQIVYSDDPVPVTEAPSLLVVVIGLGALAVGRALFA